MPSVEVDFATYKLIVALRRSEEMTEGDVVREAVSAIIEQSAPPPVVDAEPESEPTGEAGVWWHKGTKLPIGLKLEHQFRDGRVARATVVDHGLEFDGKVYRALSPAGVAAAGHQVDGWAFWSFRDERGHLSPMKTKRRF